VPVADRAEWVRGIADHWQSALASTAFSPLRRSEVREELGLLADRALQAVLSDPFDEELARSIGSAIPRLHFLRPESLELVLRTLGDDLAAGAEATQAAVSQSRINAMLAAVAAGFLEAAISRIGEEQEQIRRALLLASEQVKAAEEASRVAEAATRARTDVLNAAAHDLRSPVTVILGASDLLARRLTTEPRPPNEWLLQRVRTIGASGRRIREMIEELLDAARLHAGQQVELQLRTVDVGLLVREVVRGWEVRRPGILVQADQGLLVKGDAARLHRVVDNLLGNAIKYSPPQAPIDLEARRQDDEVAIVVRDHGVGIPADEIPQLFTPFFRASTAHGVPGIGIGLAGARTIVHQHGGRILVESVVGEGTQVTVSLPTARQE
jgi:signal transduction histidine kinase